MTLKFTRGQLFRKTPVAVAAVFGVFHSPKRASAADLEGSMGMIHETIGVGPQELVADTNPNEALAVLAYEQGRIRGVPISFTKEKPGKYVEHKECIARAAKRYPIPGINMEKLIDAVARTESGYRPRAVSHANAQGIMQLIPSTAASMGVVNPFDACQNITGGARYLRHVYDELYGPYLRGAHYTAIIRLVAAAYNAGPGAVKKYGGIPPFAETMRYAPTVLGRYNNSPVTE